MLVVRPTWVVMIGWLLWGAAAPMMAVASDSLAIEVPVTKSGEGEASQEAPVDSVRAVEVPLDESLPALTALSSAAPAQSTSQHLLELCNQALQLADQAQTAVDAPDDQPEGIAATARDLIPRMQSARSELLKLNNQLLNEQALNPSAAEGGPTGAWRDEIIGVIDRVEKGMVILDQGAGSPYDIENQLRGELVPEGTTATRMVYTDWGTPTQEPPEPRYETEIDGEIGYRSGTSTYASNENWEFELNESLTTRSDKEYRLYQSYQIDKSYVNSNELTVGAEQRFRELLWEGDLRLTEEFSRYNDEDEPLNNRQDGLFKLRFDPEWNDGEWQANVDYKYNVKAYETFSERSYIYHSGKAKLKWEINDRLSTEGWARMDDYNYSLGSTRGNDRVSTGNSWEWQASDRVRLDASAEREVKNYNVRKERSYEKLNYESGVRWQPDDDSTIELKGEFVDYNTEFSPGDAYEETRADVRVSRDLSEELDVSARYSNRAKNFDIDPLDDLDTNSYDLGLNYNPNRRWNFRADWNLANYDYASVNRAYDATGMTAGVSYSEGDVRASADWRSSENNYDSDPNRDYSRDDYNVDLDYRLGDHRMRVYYGVGLLDQADPASKNDYTETRAGAEWQFAIDPDVDLRVSYDFSKRAYDAQDDIEDTSFNAKLTFDL